MKTFKKKKPLKKHQKEKSVFENCIINTILKLLGKK